MALHPVHNEKSLLQRLSAGDEPAFRHIFDLYKERIFAVAYKMTHDAITAEEVVQETFLNLWANRSVVDKVDDPPAYIFTIAYNIIYRELKKTSQQKNLLRSFSQRSGAANADDTGTVLDYRETELLLQQAIQQLPPQRRLIFKLNREEGLTYEQIAEQLHLSPHTVRNQMAEALKQLRLAAKSAAISLFIFMLYNV